MNKAVVTGPTGAVGVALIEELVHNNWEVAAVVRPFSHRISSIPKHTRVKVVECDIAELETLPRLLEENYDAFYHFAWEGTY